MAVNEFRGVRGEAGHGAGDAVHLGDGANAKETCANAEYGKYDSEPFHVPAKAFLDASFDVVERASQYLAVFADSAVLDGEQAFGILGGHTEECGDFHPEKGSRATGTDSGGDAHDVTRADCGCKGCAESAKARHFAFAALFVVEHVAKCIR